MLLQPLSSLTTQAVNQGVFEEMLWRIRMKHYPEEVQQIINTHQYLLPNGCKAKIYENLKIYVRNDYLSFVFFKTK